MNTLQQDLDDKIQQLSDSQAAATTLQRQLDDKIQQLSDSQAAATKLQDELLISKTLLQIPEDKYCLLPSQNTDEDKSALQRVFIEYVVENAGFEISPVFAYTLACKSQTVFINFRTATEQWVHNRTNNFIIKNLRVKSHILLEDLESLLESRVKTVLCVQKSQMCGLYSDEDVTLPSPLDDTAISIEQQLQNITLQECIDRFKIVNIYGYNFEKRRNYDALNCMNHSDNEVKYGLGISLECRNILKDSRTGGAHYNAGQCGTTTRFINDCRAAESSTRNVHLQSIWVKNIENNEEYYQEFVICFLFRSVKKMTELLMLYERASDP